MTAFVREGYVPGRQYRSLYGLAEEQLGYVTAAQAQGAGLNKDTLLSMYRRGVLERISRGVYRLVDFPIAPFSQYKEANLWPADITAPLSHQSALVLYGLSDASPAKVHITVPRTYRVRRVVPKFLVVHHTDLAVDDVQTYQGILSTRPARTIRDCHTAHIGPELVRQAIDEGRRSGHLTMEEAGRLTKELFP